jgi:sugar phosphate isomerase/epimerase
VRLIALHSPSKFYEKDAVAPQIEQLRGIAAYSREMGARYQIISGGAWPHRNGHLDLETVHVWTDALNRLGKAVKEEGLTLCYHNHRTEFEGDPNPMSFFLRDTEPDLVQLNFDVGHPIGLIDPAAFSAQHFRRIAIYHIKDTVLDSSGTVAHTDLGKGHVDLKGVVAPLLDSNWSGWLEIEEDRAYPKALEHPAETLREDRQYLKRITGV